VNLSSSTAGFSRRAIDRRLRPVVVSMVEEHSRTSTVGVDVVDDEQRAEMDAARQTLTAFLKKLTHDDLLCLATHNGLFVAEGKQSVDHFIIDVKSPFIHQTIAVENSYWSEYFRPKLEGDFLTKMITVETETNVLGLPSEMIVPESIQRRGSKKNPARRESFFKVLLQPGTYVVSMEGISLVVDRASIPSLSLDVNGESKLTEHILIPMPSARIDSLFFTASPSPALLPSSNGHAHPSEDTTTEEDERPPMLQRNSEGEGTTKIMALPVEVKEEDTADETFDSPDRKEEEINGVDPTKAGRLVVRIAKKELTVLDPLVPSTASNGVDEMKMPKEEGEPSTSSRKSRSSSRTKREPWKDWVEEPREFKRISIPTRKRQMTEEAQNGVKRTKERSGSASSSTASSSTPPPTLEREEPTEESTIVKIKKARSAGKSSVLCSLKETGEDGAQPTTPLNSIISLKPQHRSMPNPTVVRLSRQKLVDNKNRRKAEDSQSPSATPSTSSFSFTSALRTNGIATVIGVKTPPKELVALITPKREVMKGVVKEEQLVKTRLQAPRAAAIKAQKEAKKRIKQMEDSEGGEEESGDDGDERAHSSEEEGETAYADVSASTSTQEDQIKERKEFKIYTIIKDESDEEKRAADEKIMERIRREEAESAAAKKKLEEKLAKREELRAERAEAIATTEAVEETPRATDAVEVEEGPRSAPTFSTRDDPFFLAMMRGGSKKNGQFLRRSLASIYQASRDFYQSLTKQDPCLEWYPRPRVGPSVDGYVHQVSGCPVKVARGAKPECYHLDDLHNHREFRLGEIVWAKFQKEYWPGYIKMFVPAAAFDEYKGDAILVQWISESELHNYLSYADVFHFDIYFGCMYQPVKSDKAYAPNVARAIAIDGRPGYWEELITKPVFDEMVKIGGNISSIPQEHLTRIEANVKTRNPTSAQVSAAQKEIHQKEINHFQRHYKTFYRGRNTHRFVPKTENCTSMFISGSDAVEEEIKITPRKTNIYKVFKDENKMYHYNVKPEYSTIPTFAEEQVEVHVTDSKTKEYDIYRLYNGASAPPIQETLYEQRPVPLGVSAGVHGGIVFDAAARARLAAYLKERKREEAALSGQTTSKEEEQPASSSTSQVEAEMDLAAAISNMSTVTSHEVLHLMDEQQQAIDPNSKDDDEAWMANTVRCAEHIRLEFEVKERKIKENNEKYEEKKRIEEERKAEAQREKEEKAAARSARTGPLVDPILHKIKKPRLSKGVEDADKSMTTTPEKVKRRLSKASESSEKTGERESPKGSPRKK
ncbi:hypothetical protein PMAYCL1PPCAC_30848, partial [Pristionchus mayeri]